MWVIYLSGSTGFSSCRNQRGSLEENVFLEVTGSQCPPCPYKRMNRASRMWFLVVMGALEVFICAAVPEWHQESGFRWAELEVPNGGRTGFHLLPPEETGISFTN